MKQFITLVYKSLDDLKLYRRKDGVFFAMNANEFLSLVGCIMIDAAEGSRDKRREAKALLKALKSAEVFSLTTGKPITVKWQVST